MRKLLLVLSFGTVLQMNAQIGGSAAFASLDLPASARMAALGGKVGSIYDHDLHLGIWNPSLLSDTCGSQVAFSFADYFTDIKFGYAALAYHFDNIGTFSLTGTRIDYGSFRETDATGATIGEFTAGEYGVTLGYSRALQHNFTFGANLKFLQSNLYLWRANALATDVAVSWHHPEKNLSASVLMRNAGLMMRTYTGGNREKLPFEILGGISFKPKHAPFRLSVTLQNLDQWDLTYEDPANPSVSVDPLTGDSIRVSKFRRASDMLGRHVVFGTEILIGKVVSLRFGYNYQRRKELAIGTRQGAVGLSFGAGIRIFKVNLAYGRSIYHLAGGVNTFSMSVRVNDFIKP